MGARYITYDPASNTIWLLTWTTEPNQALLTRYVIASQSSKTFTLPYSPDGLGVGAGMSVNNGFVWAAFGSQLVRFDPKTETPTHWTIPDLTGDIVPMDPGLDGNAVAVAVSGGYAYVGVNSAEVIEKLDPSTGKWTSISSKPVVPVGDSGLVVTPTGVVLLSGVLAGTSTPVMTAIRNGTAVVSTVSAVTLAARPDGKAAYRDSAGNLGVIQSDGTPSMLASKAAPPGAITDALAAATGIGWTWTDADGQEVFKSVTDNGTVSTYQFTFQRAPCNGPCNLHAMPGGQPSPIVTPTFLVIDPRIQGGVVDSSGNLWVAVPDDVAPYYSAVMELSPA